MEESETLEFKKSTSELKEAIISIVAILNKHQKGRLLFGVKNNGAIIGQNVTEKSLRDISKAISDHIEPKIYPKIEKERIDKKDCVVVEFQGQNIPYYAYGRTYKRIADEDKLMSAKEVEKLILEKNKEKLRWDSEICKETKLTDISPKRLKWFLKEADREYHSVENSLDKLGLLKDRKLLNAAVILFGKKPQHFFPNAKLRCAAFATTTSSLIVDRQEFEGDLFYLIDKAEEYILKNIHIGMRLEGMRRIDVPEINKEAFREGIINAFCHRDYWMYDSVNIAVFRDRVEIRSPGLLYGGLTIEKIRKENVSERRNELIAEMFHEVHFVEKWGRGISLILSKEPDTEFKEVGTHFITVFKRKGVEKVGEKWTEKLGEKLGENESKIIEQIARDNRITMVELSKKLGISEVAVYKNIKKLKQAGILERVGPAKGGHWEIKD